MRVQIDTGILGYCGLRDVETHVFYDVEQNAENRALSRRSARDRPQVRLTRAEAARSGAPQR
jgi:hypothetical protein